MKLDDKKFDEIFGEDLPEEATTDPDGKQIIQLNNSEITATVLDWMGSLFMALVCVLLVMSFAFRVIKVDGTSMEPTLIDNDKVIISNLFYTPQNGDIVVISHGEDYANPLVKRVIATAGQELYINFEKNEVYVDGVLLDEPYIQGTTVLGDKSADEINGVIPEGKVFVMGDNRVVSLDSRYHRVDLIDVSSIIGKAQLDIIPHTYSSDGNPHVDLSRIRYLYE